jgi:tetratricopeptide (TPR) repeat protein
VRDLADELLKAKVKSRLFGGDHLPTLGRLVIHDRIGSGAMGAVYAAYDPRLDRQVAVKVLHAGDPDANATSLREARALAKLAHPNVVTIHDAGEEDGAVHIVMELATGTPLRAWIHKERAWRDVVRVMREAALGLAAAHRAGVVHRDVKPDNIVVGEDTRVIDFGLATEAGDADGAGTPSYMAPEVLAGEPASALSDQFSFGVTLFEALYGERPHAGTTRDELRRSAGEASSARPGRSSSTPPATDAPRGRATQPPGWVHAIVKRALAADPAERFPSMGALAFALARDRTRVRTLYMMGLGAVAIGAVAGILGYRAQTDEDRCDGSARRVWSAEREQRIASTLGDAPWAKTAVASLRALDTQWQTTYRAVCEATRVRGEQSDRLLELRMRCLDRAHDRFAALARALEGPLENTTRVEAAGAIAQLPRPDACTSLVDAAELALPSDLALRKRALELEAQLDRAWTDYALGRYRDARDRVATILAESTKLDAVGLHANVSVLAATIESRIGEPAVARARLEAALAATAKARAAELEHLVWTRLLRHELFAGNPARVLEWESFARAAAYHAGLEGAEIDGIVGEALRDAGDPVRARDHLTRALERHDPLRGDQRAIIEMNLGSVELSMGQSFLARSAFERAMKLATEQLGEGHPSLSIYRDKLAEADRARGRIASALAHHDASIALRTAAYGERDRSVATARLHRAETLLEAGRLVRAVEDLQAAREIRANVLGDKSPRLGEIDMLLGDVELARGRSKEALVHYARAAALDPRLDLAARRLAAGEKTTAPLAPIEPFTIERAPLLIAQLAGLGYDELHQRVVAIISAWRTARSDDPALALATAEAARRAEGDAESFYRAALKALAAEPSRMRLAALRGIGDPDSVREAAELAKQMPELR